MNDNVSGCGCNCGSSDSCSSKQEKKQITIDFLYLDLNVCTRCQGAENNLDEAIAEASKVLNAAGYEIITNKINITSRELAVKYEFLSSPTIRINGRDIDLEVHETSCKDCSNISGNNVDCRSWVHEGIEYPEPPKSMIINAILKEVYGGDNTTQVTKEKYVIPKNIELYFDGANLKNK